MKNQVISWQSQRGTALTVWICECNESPSLWITNDGKGIESGNAVKLPKPTQVGSMTAVAAIGNVALTQERYDVVQAAVAKLQAEIDARPEVKLNKLVAKREQLAREIGYLVDGQHEDSQRRIEYASEHGVYRSSKRDYESEVAAARAKLAEFDAASPQAKIEIEIRKERDLQSFLAND